MIYKGNNLRTATIFDFTDDPNILNYEFGLEDFTKEEYNDMISIEARIKDLLDLAELWNDKEFENAIFETFKAELSTFGFE